MTGILCPRCHSAEHQVWNNKLFGWLQAHEASEMAKDAENLRTQLRLILPMAKGYARAHPVGNNAAYIAEAEAAIGGNDA